MKTKRFIVASGASLLAAMSLFGMPAHAGPAPAGAATFTAGGTYLVPGPAGSTVNLHVVAIGGGGGATPGESDGGEGGAVDAFIPAIAGYTLTVTVGRGGAGAASNWDGGGGGGSTAVLDGSTPLVVVGGGGGAGEGYGGYGDGGDAGDYTSSTLTTGGGTGGDLDYYCDSQGSGIGADGTGAGGAGGVIGGGASFGGSCTSLASGGTGTDGFAGAGGFGASPVGVGALGGAGYGSGGSGGLGDSVTGDLGGAGGGGAGYGGGGGSGSGQNGSRAVAGGGGGGGSYLRAVNAGTSWLFYGGNNGASSSGPSDGGDGQVDITVAGPAVLTEASAPTIGSGLSSATLHSVVNANGSDTTSIVVDYGTDPALASVLGQATLSPIQAVGASDTAVDGAIAGLTPGTVYYYRTTATNADGTTVGAIKSFIAANLPGAPQNVSSTPGDGQATVTWTAPADDGGSPITSYVVTAGSGGATCTVNAPATTCTITGLTNGTAYTFSVVAVNGVGTGTQSRVSAAVTPAAAPTTTTTTTPVVSDAAANTGSPSSIREFARTGASDSGNLSVLGLGGVFAGMMLMVAGRRRTRTGSAA